MLLTVEQTLINEALVAKVLQCEKTEAALRASEKKLNELLAHQVASREEERKRIVREIDSNLGKNLVALRTDISALHARTAAHPRLHDWVDKALDNLDSTISSVGQIVAHMRPFQIELGVVAAVEWELDKFERSSGLRCKLSRDAHFDDKALSDEQTLALYRALQECLSNVFRHSLASRVDVSLALLNNAVSMTVGDNGVGFDTGQARKSSSYGLLDVEERMTALGGQLSVTGSRPHGTTVTLSIPLVRFPSRDH
ncbi:sensor histidine kinase [Massilia sp. TWR1-2-2]|uniref:sensor histidine kinase n=1 Tax=Massilia sp. TWR1-2-2 TaxID=2804584 RepID=UPI003CF845B5